MNKKKFKPEMTRIRLNPEQAVLVCNCYQFSYRLHYGPGGMNQTRTVCFSGKLNTTASPVEGSQASS